MELDLSGIHDGDIGKALTALPLPVIIGISVVALGLIFIIVVVCVMYRRKSRQSDQAAKEMQNRMDIMEARVAKECKEGMSL